MHLLWVSVLLEGATASDGENAYDALAECFQLQFVKSTMRGLNQGAEWCRTLADKPWDASAWISAFNRLSGKDVMEKRLLVGGQATTIKALLDGSYLLPDGKRVELPREVTMAAAANTVYYSDICASESPETTKVGSGETIVECWHADGLEAAWALQDMGFNPCVLNFAQHHHPGGGWACGDWAQEESLFRRSGYLPCLLSRPPVETGLRSLVDADRESPYPLAEFGVVYSPSVPTFRTSECEGLRFLRRPRNVSFIAAAAYACPQLEGGEYPNGRLSDYHLAGMRRKVSAVVRAAALNGHDALVLGTWGCGCFRNPPKHVAEIFASVLAEQRLRGGIRHVVFTTDHPAFEALFGRCRPCPTYNDK